MLIHRNNCTTPVEVTYTGKLGDNIRKCRTCHARMFERPEPPVALVDAATPAGARYVCPVHGEPVNWRGSGCDGCARQRLKREARRAAARAARVAS